MDPYEPTGARLLVANRTLTDPAVATALRSRPRATWWHIVVPATEPDRAGREFLAAEHVRTDGGDGPAVALARVRLRWMLDQLAVAGVAADGEVGDPDPVRATAAALRREPRVEVVEIVLALLPGGRSVWRRERVAQRLAAQHALPVRTVTADGQGAGRISRAATSR